MKRTASSPEFDLNFGLLYLLAVLANEEKLLLIVDFLLASRVPAWRLGHLLLRR